MPSFATENFSLFYVANGIARVYTIHVNIENIHNS